MIRKRRKPRPGRASKAQWEKIRLFVFNRANARCEHCGCYMLYRPRWDGDPLGFDPAHIRGKRMHGDDPSNIRALCHHDHVLEHAYGKSFEKPCPAKEVAA